MPKNKQKDSLKRASKGAALGVFVYLILTILKIGGAFLFASDALNADGLNNLSDIISAITVWIGLKLAQRPSDDDHHFDHHKYETIASFITSLIMFTIGFEIIRIGVTKFIHYETALIAVETFWISLFSAITLFFTASYNYRLAKKTNSLSLKATAKDMFNDMLISIGSIIGIIGALMGFPRLDTIVSVFIGFVILWTAFQIFKDSTFILSDGFDQEYLNKYERLLLTIPTIKNISHLRGRRSGPYIYVDVTIEVDQNMTVYASHKITEEIEQLLLDEYQIQDVDVHVEPYIR